MKDYLANKTVGFYFTIAATILAVIGLVNYSSASGAIRIVFVLVGAAIAVEALLLVLSALIGNRTALNLASSVCAVLMATALVQSFTTQLDPLGFVVSGLYTIDQVMAFLIFAGFAAASMLLYIVASFMNLGKQR